MGIQHRRLSTAQTRVMLTCDLHNLERQLVLLQHAHTISGTTPFFGRKLVSSVMTRSQRRLGPAETVKTAGLIGRLHCTSLCSVHSLHQGCTDDPSPAAAGPARDEIETMLPEDSCGGPAGVLGLLPSPGLPIEDGC